MCVRPADEHFSFVCESLLYSEERHNATKRLIQLAMARRVRETNRREPICKVWESRKEISVEEIHMILSRVRESSGEIKGRVPLQ